MCKKEGRKEGKREEKKKASHVKEKYLHST
jgi:hypothetical protein